MFVNLTPHEIVIINADGEVALRVASSGSLRAAEVVEPAASVDGVEVVATSFAALEGADITPREGVTFIVSPFVATHPELAGRTDVVCPDTGPASVVRDEAGRIVGVKRFRRLR